jgi:hypothetical protein
MCGVFVDNKHNSALLPPTTLTLPIGSSRQKRNSSGSWSLYTFLSSIRLTSRTGSIQSYWRDVQGEPPPPACAYPVSLSVYIRHGQWACTARRNFLLSVRHTSFDFVCMQPVGGPGAKKKEDTICARKPETSGS